MRKFNVLFGMGLLATFVFTLAGCDTTAALGGTYLTVEINPGMEFVLDEDDIVEEVNALNEDGEVVLIDLDLVGKKIDEVVEVIIDRATELGYLGLEGIGNEIRIMAIGNTEEMGERVSSHVRTQLSAALAKRGIPGTAAIKAANQEMVQEASQRGVSVGKLIMAKNMQQENPELDLDELLEMPQEELINMKKEHLREMKEVAAQLRTDFHENLVALVLEYGPQLETLEAEIAELEAVLEGETDESIIADLTASIDQKNADLVELEAAFKAEREALREEFLQLSRPILEDKREEFQNRIDQYKQTVEQFRENNPLPEIGKGR